MPSPILHTGAGLALAWAAWRRAPAGGRFLPFALFSVVVSSAPDLDYLPGLAIGQLNAFHQGPTHSLLAVGLLAAGLACWPRLRKWMAPEWSARRFFAFSLLLGIVHLALDVFTQDFRPPIGIPLFWPLPLPHVHAPGPWLFPAWEKMALSDLFSPANLRPVLVETACAAVLLAAAALVPGRKKSPAESTAGR